MIHSTQPSPQGKCMRKCSAYLPCSFMSYGPGSCAQHHTLPWHDVSLKVAKNGCGLRTDWWYRCRTNMAQVQFASGATQSFAAWGTTPSADVTHLHVMQALRTNRGSQPCTTMSVLSLTLQTAGLRQYIYQRVASHTQHVFLKMIILSACIG